MGGAGMAVGDAAAGMRQMTDQHAHCLSCDRPLQLSKDPKPSIPSKDNSLMPPKSIKPYTTYELEQIRQQSKGYGPAHLSNFERAMMERQLTRIKIRDLRSDYANYWRNEDTCASGPKGTKLIRKTKGMQVPSVEQVEVQAIIQPKRACGGNGVQNKSTPYVKSIPMPDINSMFSEENLARKDKTAATEGQLRSVGAPPTKWQSGTSLGSGGSGKGQAVKKESIEKAIPTDRRSSNGSKTGATAKALLMKVGSVEKRSSTESAKEKAAQLAKSDHVGDSLGADEAAAAAADDHAQEGGAAETAEEGGMSGETELTDIDEMGETDYEEEEAETMDVHHDHEETADNPEEESAVDEERSADEEMPAPA